MYLKSLELTNYRCYQNLVITLDGQTTVLVADNGGGKTAILDAIRVALWPYISRFDLAKTAYADPANTLTIDDVRIIESNHQPDNNIVGALNEMTRQLPASIKSVGDYGVGETTWERYRDSEAPRSQTKDDQACREMKSHAEKLQQTARNMEVNVQPLPVFGYYGTGRLWKEKRLTESKKGSKTHDKNIRTFAYRDCLDPASSYRQFEEWFIKAYKKVLESQIQRLQQGATFLDVDPQLKVPVKVVQDAVDEVLKPVGWKHLQFSQRDEALVLSHCNYGVMKADQLSDGIKNILAMIADIAYRCVLLNGHLGERAAKESEGIVMIDEVDMHLHPKWQQTVVGSLQVAFPKLQFILTTHSPQVLSTVPAKRIRVIHHEQNKETGETKSSAKVAAVQSLGVASADVMADLQHVNTVPDVEESRWLRDYKKMIDANQQNTEEGVRLKNRILDHFGESHHEWQECARLIRLQAMKMKLPRR